MSQEVEDQLETPSTTPSPPVAASSSPSQAEPPNKDFVCLWSTCYGCGFDCLEELAIHIDQEHLAQFSTRKNVCCKWRSCKRIDPFADITLLSQHIRSHTGEKPFKCSVKNCESKFAAKSNLIAHCKRRHGRIIEPLYLDPKELLKAGIRTTRETLMAESVASAAERQNASGLNAAGSEKHSSHHSTRVIMMNNGGEHASGLMNSGASSAAAAPTTRRGAHKRIHSTKANQNSSNSVNLNSSSTYLSNPILAVYGSLNGIGMMSNSSNSGSNSAFDSEIDEYSDFEELLQDNILFSSSEEISLPPPNATQTSGKNCCLISEKVSDKIVKLGAKIASLDASLEQICKLHNETCFLLGKYACFEVAVQVPPFSPITQNLMQYKHELGLLKVKVELKLRKYRSMQENIKVKIFKKNLGIIY